MNDQSEQVNALKQAILERAEKLAREHIAQGKLTRQKIMEDSREKVHLMEQKELLYAKSQADREYLRSVQASEINEQAELDRNRWGMVQVQMQKLTRWLAQLVENEEQYLPILIDQLKQAAELISQKDMVAYLNSNDLQRFKPQWNDILKQADLADISLADKPVDISGGIKLVSADGNIRVDNSFEGLLARKEQVLKKAIFEKLFASVTGTGVINHG